MRIALFIFSIVLAGNSFASGDSTKRELSFLFIGDIMGHDAQIISAYDSATASYYYEDVFAPIKEILEKPDFCVANLEVTLAGKPHKGYPQFSSPDELALACKNSGIDVLATANNHSCDRGKDGIIRTANVLDFYKLKHTGTFRDKADKDSMNILILEKNNIRVALLNYTYGTNGLPFPNPTLVNMIDRDSIAEDLRQARKMDPDKIIVFLHWGIQYEVEPNEDQRSLAKFLFETGADIVIGSHPHVIQPMEYRKDNQGTEQMVVYSLGNFVSNQRKFRTDGGSMVGFTLEKEDDQTRIKDQGFYLTWVNKYKEEGKSKFEILSCTQVERNEFEGLDEEAIEKFRIFTKDSRARLQEENVNFPEKVNLN